MRRLPPLAPLALAIGLLVSGCGTERPTAAGAADAQPGTGEVRSGDVLTLTPGGVAPFQLGMTVEEARAAGGTVRRHGGATACPELSWTDSSGVVVHGAFSPGAGLGYVSVDGGRTAEGITLGATVADLHAAYPDLQRADNGLLYVDRDPGDLTFATYAGGVSWMVAIGDDQHCAS